MLKSILVGLDGTAHSRAAVELGFQWAKRFNALLVGIGILDKRHAHRRLFGGEKHATTGL